MFFSSLSCLCTAVTNGFWHRESVLPSAPGRQRRREGESGRRKKNELLALSEKQHRKTKTVKRNGKIRKRESVRDWGRTSGALQVDLKRAFQTPTLSTFPTPSLISTQLLSPVGASLSRITTSNCFTHFRWSFFSVIISLTLISKSFKPYLRDLLLGFFSNQCAIQNENSQLQLWCSPRIMV